MHFLSKQQGEGQHSLQEANPSAARHMAIAVPAPCVHPLLLPTKAGQQRDPTIPSTYHLIPLPQCYFLWDKEQGPNVIDCSSTGPFCSSSFHAPSYTKHTCTKPLCSITYQSPQREHLSRIVNGDAEQKKVIQSKAYAQDVQYLHDTKMKEVPTTRSPSVQMLTNASCSQQQIPAWQ